MHASSTGTKEGSVSSTVLVINKEDILVRLQLPIRASRSHPADSDPEGGLLHNVPDKDQAHPVCADDPGPGQ